MSYPFLPARRKRVLVSDDSAAVRIFVRNALERFGIRVDDADFRAGVALASSRPRRFDLVITNQPEWFLALNAQVVYMASLPDPYLSSRCVGTIQKPFTADALLSVAAVCLGLSKELDRRTGKVRIIAVQENRSVQARAGRKV